MGADIHLYVEVKKDGEWKSIDQWVDEIEEGEEPRKVAVRDDRFHVGRNYDLFAILADVRNGRGFAGIRTGSGFVPICAPKGLPVDASPEVAAESASWGIDGHSHSWLTVAELLAYDWTQVTSKEGWINGPEFFEWNRYQRGAGLGPDSYCNGISGVGIDHISLADMEQKIEKLTTGKDYRDRAKAVEALCQTYALAEWKEPYYRAAGKFLGELMPELWRLGSHDEVRLVFWFDN